MSIDQPELSESDRAPHEQRLDGAGAEYAPDGEVTVDGSQRLENACRNCGHKIESHVARVVGDNDGCVNYCARDECREDVLDEHQLEAGEYNNTLRLTLYLLQENRGAGLDNTAGGRR